jgi:hypothetical protein
MAKLHLLEGDAKLLRGHGKRFICLVCHGCELYLTPAKQLEQLEPTKP